MSQPSSVLTLLIGVALTTSVAACSDGGDADVGAIERGLEQIPLSVLDQADGASRYVEVVDFVAINELYGVPAPVAGRDTDEVLDSLIEVSGTRSADEPRIAVTWSVEPSVGRARPEDFEAEIGLDVGAIEMYAGFNAPPVNFSAYTGDLELSTSLDEVGGGVSTLGDGEDLENDLDAVSPLSPIGVPLRLARRDGAVAASTITPAIEEWLDDDSESVADDDRFVEVARAFDRLDAPTALIVESDFTFGPDAVLGSNGSPEQVARIQEELGGEVIDEPFGVVGVGGAEIEGEVAMVAVYLFATEDAAADSVEQIEDLWTDGQLFRTNQPIDESVTLDSVTAEGRTVTILATPLDGRSTDVGIGFLFSQDIVFLHR